MTNWIKTSDRMPEPLEDVLVCIRGMIGLGYAYKGQWWYGDAVTGDVTYWMSLPEPPAE